MLSLMSFDNSFSFAPRALHAGIFFHEPPPNPRLTRHSDQRHRPIASTHPLHKMAIPKSSSSLFVVSLPGHDRHRIMATTKRNRKFEIVLYGEPFVEELDDLLLRERQIPNKNRDPRCTSHRKASTVNRGRHPSSPSLS